MMNLETHRVTVAETLVRMHEALSSRFGDVVFRVELESFAGGETEAHITWDRSVDAREVSRVARGFTRRTDQLGICPDGRLVKLSYALDSVVCYPAPDELEGAHRTVQDIS